MLIRYFGVKNIELDIAIYYLRNIIKRIKEKSMKTINYAYYYFYGYYPRSDQ